MEALPASSTSHPDINLLSPAQPQRGIQLFVNLFQIQRVTTSSAAINFKMKQKLVLQLNMFDEKRRSKAMKAVVVVEGVLSVALDGKDKTKLVVIGEDMDSFELVTSLRNKKFRVDMESLEEVKSEKKNEGKEEKKAVPQWQYICQPTVPQHLVYNQAVHPAVYHDGHIQPDVNCSIM